VPAHEGDRRRVECPIDLPYNTGLGPRLTKRHLGRFARPSGLTAEPVVKSKIHPKYQVCSVHCACGNTFTTRSTQVKINVDICSNCHPFFTGKQKFVDTAGRLERFSKKFGGSYSFQRAGAPPAAAGAKK
jgi:large subunit ribosomal protein L31